MKENDFIALLKQRFPDADLGDDCAVVRPPGGEMLLASDAVVEGVHFAREFSAPGQAVQKAITSNVSDIYSMGGEPLFILLTAGIPDGAVREEIEGVIEGIAAAVRFYDIRLAGGDTVLSPGGWFFDVSITGEARMGGAVRRSGARPGDLILLSGRCGASLAGLDILVAAGRGEEETESDLSGPEWRALLKAARDSAGGFDISTTKKDIEGICAARGLGPSAASVLDMVRHHIVPASRPLPRTVTAGMVTSMIDVSDGIARDLASLCEAGGTGASIDLAGLPAHEGLRGLESMGAVLSGRTVEETVLSSGEEYLMLFTAPARFATLLEEYAFIIGEVRDESEGITATGPGGDRSPLPGRGYEHGF